MEALDAFWDDEDIHGEAHAAAFGEDQAPPATFQGPRQLLLEAAPCAACHKSFTPATSTQSVVCDRCNNPFHLRCTKLKQIPVTYWYCAKCAAHHHARGLQCPTEDLAL